MRETIKWARLLAFVTGLVNQELLLVPTKNSVCVENIEVVQPELIASKIHAQHLDSPFDRTLSQLSEPC